jgi:hypothetical protein
MLRRLFTPMTAAAVLCGGLLLPSVRADEINNSISKVAAKPNGLGTGTEDLHPFTHFAYVPAGADLSTIRFEKVRLVKVPTKIKVTTDASHCKELAFRDPGASCTYTQTEASAPAYEVTYSLTGQPLASDEYADRHFTFSVEFRTDELAADVQKALSAKRLSRSDATAYFAVSTHRESVRRVAIDEKQSRFCAGNFVDGVWAHTDAGCQDDVSYTMVTVPSDYMTIQVDPVSLRTERAGLVSAK